MAEQLTLNVGLSDRACFDNFLVGDNVEVVNALEKFAAGGAGLTYIFGDRGSGKTHLLYSVQKTALARKLRAGYFAMSDTDAVRSFSGFVDDWDLVCVDDVQLAAGRRDLETLLFNVLEQQRQVEGATLIAGTASVQGLDFSIRDLASRLGGAVLYRLRPLRDDQKKQAMRLRAQSRGFDLPDEVVEYVMKRFSRDVAELFSLLDEMDKVSLSTQRKISIPLVKGLENRRS